MSPQINHSKLSLSRSAVSISGIFRERSLEYERALSQTAILEAAQAVLKRRRSVSVSGKDGIGHNLVFLLQRIVTGLNIPEGLVLALDHEFFPPCAFKNKSGEPVPWTDNVCRVSGPKGSLSGIFRSLTHAFY